MGVSMSSQINKKETINTVYRVNSPIYQKYKQMDKTFRSQGFFEEKEFSHRAQLSTDYCSKKSLDPSKYSILNRWIESGEVQSGTISESNEAELVVVSQLDALYRSGESRIVSIEDFEKSLVSDQKSVSSKTSFCGSSIQDLDFTSAN